MHDMQKGVAHLPRASAVFENFDGFEFVVVHASPYGDVPTYVKPA
jgi:hypothetical protein